MLMSHHACDLCGTDAPRPLPQDPRISVCGNCGFVYVSERRSSAEIAASWGQLYESGAYDPNWPAVKARLYYVAEWIDQNIGLAGKSLLDIGAGRGQFIDEARRRAANCFGLEPAGDGRHPHIWPHSIETSGLAEQFDIVTICWTLENCGDCMAMLRFAREHCKPDGWVVVATGSRILVPFKKPLSKYLNKDIPADLHCFRWSMNSLTGTGVIAGMRTIKVNPHQECDWLVVAFQPSNVVLEPVPGLPYFHDDPNTVLAYFDMWSKVCS
jgi:hypothetical protein